MQTIDPLLESEYNNRAMVPEHPQIFERWRKRSAAVRALTDCVIDLPYGDHPRQRLDIFRARAAVGSVLFIHGGYWRSLDKSDFSFVAEPLLRAGLSVVAINYRLCPLVSVADIIADCRLALDWLAMNGTGLDLNISKVALAGHSAGGHLVASLFAIDHAARPAKALNLVGGAAISGVFELAPLLRCSMNNDLHLDADTAHALSPTLHQPRLSVPLLLAAGADESAAFRQQTSGLAAAWPTVCASPVTLDGCNHFTIVDECFQDGSTVLVGLRRLFD